MLRVRGAGTVLGPAAWEREAVLPLQQKAPLELMGGDSMLQRVVIGRRLTVPSLSHETEDSVPVGILGCRVRIGVYSSGPARPAGPDRPEMRPPEPVPFTWRRKGLRPRAGLLCAACDREASGGPPVDHGPPGRRPGRGRLEGHPSVRRSPEQGELDPAGSPGVFEEQDIGGPALRVPRTSRSPTSRGTGHLRRAGLLDGKWCPRTTRR